MSNKIGFTIPANSVPDSSSVHPEYNIVPDLGRKKDVTYNTISNTSGSAEQRSLSGINPAIRTFQVSFTNRPEAEMDYIEQFIRQKKGCVAFPFTVLDLNGTEVDTEGNPVTTYQVYCDSYSVQYSSCNSRAITAQFKTHYLA